MNELRELLIEYCERKLEYYDVVDEYRETIDYGKIIDALVQRLFGGAEDGK